MSHTGPWARTCHSRTIAFHFPSVDTKHMGMLTPCPSLNHDPLCERAVEPPGKHWSKSLSSHLIVTLIVVIGWRTIANQIRLRSDFEVSFLKSTHCFYFKNTIHHQSNLLRVTYTEQICACSSFLLLRSIPEQGPAIPAVLLGSLWVSLTTFPLQVVITPAITTSSEITVSSVCTDCGVTTLPIHTLCWVNTHPTLPHVPSLSVLHFCHHIPALILTKGLRASPGKSLLQEAGSEHSHCSRAVSQQLALETRAGIITTKPRRRLRHRSRSWGRLSLCTAELLLLVLLRKYSRECVIVYAQILLSTPN